MPINQMKCSRANIQHYNTLVCVRLLNYVLKLPYQVSFCVFLSKLKCKVNQVQSKTFEVTKYVFLLKMHRNVIHFSVSHPNPLYKGFIEKCLLHFEQHCSQMPSVKSLQTNDTLYLFSFSSMHCAQIIIKKVQLTTNGG